jgi:polyhydroxyalkanoate synthesis regulator phasin
VGLNKAFKTFTISSAKYKNGHIGMINTVRVSHANSKVINELMKTGNVNLPESEKTWENLKSEGKTWKEILNTIDIGHMALLRNLRNIFSEDLSYDEAKKVLNDLVAGVKDGKQFPFRYWSAYNAIKLSGVNHAAMILDALEGCMDESLNSMPKLNGKLCAYQIIQDPHGEHLTVSSDQLQLPNIVTINNNSAKNSDEGSVGLLGDKLKTFEISKRSGILSDLADMRKVRGSIPAVELKNGIWLFFRDAINKKEHWDNIFIYSDMQVFRSWVDYMV